MRVVTRLIGGPGDGTKIRLDSKLEIWNYLPPASDPSRPRESAPVERYVRHRLISAYGTPFYVYAHSSMSAEDVMEAWL